MKIIGVFVIVNTLAIGGWWLGTSQPNPKSMSSFFLLCLFFGVFLSLHDRVQEVTIDNVGSIKAAVERAEGGAQEIEELQKRVEAQAATVDLVAQSAADAKRLTEDLRKKSAAAEQELGRVDAAMREAASVLKHVQATGELTTTIALAQNDDRDAFDRLFAWSQDANHPYRLQAERAWATILDSHAPMMVAGGFTIPWNAGVDPSKFTMDQLHGEYLGAPIFLRPALLEYIWVTRTDIPKHVRMLFLSQVLTEEKSLRALEYAGRYFAEGAELKLKPLAVSEMLKWWKANQKTVR